MAAVWFRNDDPGYLTWCEQHPTGYVVNTRREVDPNYTVLHRATCTAIRKYAEMDVRPGGFTERQYSKCCADSVEELRAVLESCTARRDPFSQVCHRCNPR